MILSPIRFYFLTKLDAALLRARSQKEKFDLNPQINNTFDLIVELVIFPDKSLGFLFQEKKELVTSVGASKAFAQEGKKKGERRVLGPSVGAGG